MGLFMKWLERMPHDEVLQHRAGTLLKLVREEVTERPKHVLSTREAAEEFGYSHTYWKKWAGEGKIWTDTSDGERVAAWQDDDGAPWRLPYIACVAHLDRLRTRASKTGGKRRGPWKKKPRLVQDGEAP